ncbi:MAG: helix-turn-helix domain-containing protein [Saccharofermentanales bacterium]
MELKNSIADFIRTVDIEKFIWLYYTREFMAGFSMTTPHTHMGYEFVLVNEGTCYISDGSNLVTMHKNDFIIIDSSVLHKFYVEEKYKCTITNIHFFFDTCDKTTINELSAIVDDCVTDKSFYKIKNSQDIKRLITVLISYLSNNESNSYLSVSLSFCELLLVIKKIFSMNKENIPSNQQDYINIAIEYIKINFHLQINPEIIAKEVHLSSDYLQHLFKKRTGNSIMDYVLSIRIEHSKIILKNTDLSLTEVAISSGIHNSQYFSTCFRKQTGMSPSKYRKLSRFVNNGD